MTARIGYNAGIRTTKKSTKIGHVDRAYVAASASLSGTGLSFRLSHVKALNVDFGYPVLPSLPIVVGDTYFAVIMR